MDQCSGRCVVAKRNVRLSESRQPALLGMKNLEALPTHFWSLSIFVSSVSQTFVVSWLYERMGDNII